MKNPPKRRITGLNGAQSPGNVTKHDKRHSPGSMGFLALIRKRGEA
jgi:hypothetical protein